MKKFPEKFTSQAESTYLYRWGNTLWRIKRQGRICKIIKNGASAALVEWVDTGIREMVDRAALVRACK